MQLLPESADVLGVEYALAAPAQLEMHPGLAMVAQCLLEAAPGEAEEMGRLDDPDGLQRAGPGWQRAGHVSPLAHASNRRTSDRSRYAHGLLQPVLTARYSR